MATQVMDMNGGYINSTSSMTFGNSVIDDSNPFKGTIGYMLVYNRTLTEREMTLL